VCGAERSKEIEMISKWTPLPAGFWGLSGPRDGWGANGRRCQRGFAFEWTKGDGDHMDAVASGGVGFEWTKRWMGIKWTPLSAGVCV
jgi:hypothetical protein